MLSFICSSSLHSSSLPFPLCSPPPDCFSSREIFTLTHTFHRMQSMVRWSHCGEAWGQAEHHGNKNVRDSKASHLQKNPQPLNWHQRLDTTTPNQRLDTTTPNQRLYGIKMQIHLGRDCLNPWRGSLFRTNFLRKCSPGAVTRYTEVTVAAGYITSQQKGLVLMSMWC